MSGQTFTPTNVVDMNKERDWASSIGMMDWDTTKIVFTKRTLIEFLKYTGTTVDTNFSNIAKLPKYAKFGKITGEASEILGSASTDLETPASPTDTDSAFKPSRRVRASPGGPTSDIFEEEFADDALSHATPRQRGVAAETEVSGTQAGTVAKDDAYDPGVTTSGPRPSRRVRTAPGGKDSLTDLLSGDGNDNREFKPTRKVRQRPGGEDSVASILG